MASLVDAEATEHRLCHRDQGDVLMSYEAADPDLTTAGYTVGAWNHRNPAGYSPSPVTMHLIATRRVRMTM